MKYRDDITECYGCGLFIAKETMKRGLKTICPRCNSGIREIRSINANAFYYALTAILLFILLNFFPLLTLTINNTILTTSLFGSVNILFSQNLFFVGLIVFITIILAPILNLSLILMVFLQKKTKVTFFSKNWLHTGFHFVKHWAFVDVFAISLIVAYIKLIGMESSTKFDIGFYLLLIYLLFIYLSNKHFDDQIIFHE